MADILGQQALTNIDPIDGTMDFALGLQDAMGREVFDGLSDKLDSALEVERAAAQETLQRILARIEDGRKVLASQDRLTELELFKNATLAKLAVNWLTMTPQDYAAKISTMYGGTPLPTMDPLEPTPIQTGPSAANTGSVSAPDTSPIVTSGVPTSEPPVLGSPPPPLITEGGGNGGGAKAHWYLKIICRPDGSYTRTCEQILGGALLVDNKTTFGPFLTQDECMKFVPPQNPCKDQGGGGPPPPPKGCKNVVALGANFVVQTETGQCQVFKMLKAKPLGPLVQFGCCDAEGNFWYGVCQLECGQTCDKWKAPDGWTKYFCGNPYFFDQAAWDALMKECGSPDNCVPPPPPQGAWYSVLRCRKDGTFKIECIESDLPPDVIKPDKILANFKTEDECKAYKPPAQLCPKEGEGDEPPPPPEDWDEPIIEPCAEPMARAEKVTLLCRASTLDEP